MRKKEKRFLSMLLAVICILGVLATPAMASELYEKQPTSTEKTDDPDEKPEKKTIEIPDALRKAVLKYGNRITSIPNGRKSYPFDFED